MSVFSRADPSALMGQLQGVPAASASGSGSGSVVQQQHELDMADALLQSEAMLSSEKAEKKKANAEYRRTLREAIQASLREENATATTGQAPAGSSFGVQEQQSSWSDGRRLHASQSIFTSVDPAALIDQLRSVSTTNAIGNRTDADDEEQQCLLETGTGCRDGRGHHTVRGKKNEHAKQAFLHWQCVVDEGLGRPCINSCPFGRRCPMNFTPAQLLRAHETSYGTSTSRKLLPDGNYMYDCEFRKGATSATWKRLAAAAFVQDPANPGVCRQMFTIEGCGPVCRVFWRSAYGIPEGTSNKLLAAAAKGAPPLPLPTRTLPSWLPTAHCTLHTSLLAAGVKPTPHDAAAGRLRADIELGDNIDRLQGDDASEVTPPKCPSVLRARARTHAPTHARTHALPPPRPLPPSCCLSHRRQRRIA